MSSLSVLFYLLLASGQPYSVDGYPERMLNTCNSKLVVGASIMGKPASDGQSSSVAMTLTKKSEGDFYLPNESINLKVDGLGTASHLLVVSGGAKLSQSGTGCQDTRGLLQSTTLLMPPSGEVSITVGWSTRGRGDSRFTGVQIKTRTLLPAIVGMCVAAALFYFRQTFILQNLISFLYSRRIY